MKKSMPIAINYGQIIVFLKNLARPGLLWSQEEHDQGFAWDDGIVTFNIPDHDGECLLTVRTQPSHGDKVDEDVIWAIDVPFFCSEEEVQIGTILEEATFFFDVGSYQLRFEARSGSKIEDIPYAYDLTLIFVADTVPKFSILRQGPLGSSSVLRTRADRA